MTLSTISSGVGLKNFGAKESQTVDYRIQPHQNSAGATTATADSSEVRAVLLYAPAHSPSQHKPSEPPVTPVINGLGLGLKFSTDKETGTPIITVIDLKSGKVVRQIPSEEVVNFLRQFENSKGALLSVKL